MTTTMKALQAELETYKTILHKWKHHETTSDISFTLVDALQGKQPTEKYREFQALLESVHLDRSFFSNAPPLYERLMTQYNHCAGQINQKNLYLQGISIA